MWEAFLKLLAALFAPGSGVSPPPPPARPQPTPPSVGDDTMIHLLEEHNSFRRNNGVQPLTLNERLNQAAKKHAWWMAVNRNMSHNQTPGTQGFTGRTFVDRLKAEGYTPRMGGENAAAGQRTPYQVMDAWMNSPGHRANILNDAYWNVGFGVAEDKYGHLYWCAVFATPMPRTVVRIVVSLPPALVN